MAAEESTEVVVDDLGYIDYTDQLDDIIYYTEITSENSAYLEYLEYLGYLPKIYEGIMLIFAIILVYMTFKALLSFVGRCFGDR